MEQRKTEHFSGSPRSKRLYTLAESAEYLGRTVNALRELIWNGLLPVVQHKRKQWVDRLDLDAFIERNKTYID